jgi:hypothetical protein
MCAKQRDVTYQKKLLKSCFNQSINPAHLPTASQPSPPPGSKILGSPIVRSKINVVSKNYSRNYHQHSTPSPPHLFLKTSTSGFSVGCRPGVHLCTVSSLGASTSFAVFAILGRFYQRYRSAVDIMRAFGNSLRPPLHHPTITHLSRTQPP